MLTPEQYQEAKAIFHEALDRAPEEIPGYLNEVCANRPEIRAEVEFLLGSDAELAAAEGVDTDADIARPAEIAGVVRPEIGHPERVGRYAIVDVLGEGGMGVVYLAEQTEPVKRQVALKLVRFGLDSPEVVSRFESERQALALMTHSNIARVYDAGTSENGLPFVVMEHVPGVPVTEYCDQHSLPIRERLELFVRICEGVQHAHQKAIIHRDIKPSNILVMVEDATAIPKIIDFGIAKAVGPRMLEQTAQTAQGQLVGTPTYMSPEQADGSLDIDTRTDIYSLGVLLYELLVGALPFDFTDASLAGLAEIRYLICEAEPKRPSHRLAELGQESSKFAAQRGSGVTALVRELRTDLDWIVLKALEKDRKRRYASTSELSRDVEKYLAHQPVSAGPPSSAYVLRKFVRRHRTKLTVTAGVLALLATVGSGTRYLAEHRERLAEEQASADLRKRADDLWETRQHLKGSLPQRLKRWEDLVHAHAPWEPVWHREDELAAWASYVDDGNRVDKLFTQATLLLSQAQEIAPTGSVEADQAALRLEELYFRLSQEAEKEGGARLAPEHFRLLMESLGKGTYDNWLSHGDVTLASDPPGAEVYCFRYVERETRLLPLPFDPAAGHRDPAAGLVGQPFLRVDQVLDTSLPFQPGDRLVQVNTRPIGLRGELAAALAETPLDGELEATIQRQGETLKVRWVPFSGTRDPELAKGINGELPPRVLGNVRAQLGMTFEGYPLDFPAACRVGTTRSGSALQLKDLPQGSYLFIFRKEGYVDTRYPVAVPGATTRETVQLIRPEEFPAGGFVYIPAGTFAHGEVLDPDIYEYYQSLPRGDTRLPGFFISRHEVTAEDYLEFINDPQVREHLDDNGEARPVTAVVRELLKRTDSNDKFALVPWYGFERRPHFERPDLGKKTWRLGKLWLASWPVFEVQQIAAVEYAAWRTRRDERGFVYRLPTDREWEKAARGVDRRTYVWGDYFVRSFCWSGDFVKSPSPVGQTPTDESVFGVRDLAGSVSEHTSGQPVKGGNYTSLRGGSWYTSDAYRYRIMTRFGRKPERTASMGAGFRLVATRASKDLQEKQSQPKAATAE